MNVIIRKRNSPYGPHGEYLISAAAQESCQIRGLGGCAVPPGEGVREVIRAIRVTLCSHVARRQPVGKPCVSPCSLVPARHEPTLTRGRIEAEAADPPGSTPAGYWCHRSRPSPLRECCRFLTFFPFSPPSLYFKKFEDFTHHGHLALYQILGSNTPWTQGPATHSRI